MRLLNWFVISSYLYLLCANTAFACTEEKANSPQQIAIAAAAKLIDTKTPLRAPLPVLNQVLSNETTDFDSEPAIKPEASTLHELDYAQEIKTPAYAAAYQSATSRAHRSRAPPAQKS